MKANIKKKVVYTDLLDQDWKTEQQAQMSNHDIQLKFRQYIEEELFRTFSDGRLNKLETTKELWTCLDFTPKCIKEICEIMDK